VEIAMKNVTSESSLEGPLMKTKSRTQNHEYGWRVGKYWVQFRASLVQIERLVGFIGTDPSRFASRIPRWEAVEVANKLLEVITGFQIRDYEEQEKYTYNLGLVFETREDLKNPDILQGFFAGSLEGWAEVRDRLKAQVELRAAVPPESPVNPGLSAANGPLAEELARA
jgi:hypothetical protein